MKITRFLVQAATPGDTGGSKPGDMLNFSDSAMVLLISMAVIFAMLILLMGILYLFKLFSVMENKAGSEDLKKQATATIAEDDDEETVAAIISAVGVYMEAENITAPFIIKKIKRTN